MESHFLLGTEFSVYFFASFCGHNVVINYFWRHFYICLMTWADSTCSVDMFNVFKHVFLLTDCLISRTSGATSHWTGAVLLGDRTASHGDGATSHSSQLSLSLKWFFCLILTLTLINAQNMSFCTCFFYLNLF